MSGLVPVGIELVAAGADAFKAAGEVVADVVSHVNESFEKTNTSALAGGQGLQTYQSYLELLRQKLQQLQAAQVQSIEQSGEINKGIQSQITQVQTLIRYYQQQVDAVGRASQAIQAYNEKRVSDATKAAAAEEAAALKAANDAEAADEAQTLAYEKNAARRSAAAIKAGDDASKASQKAAQDYLNRKGVDTGAGSGGGGGSVFSSLAAAGGDAAGPVAALTVGLSSLSGAANGVFGAISSVVGGITQFVAQAVQAIAAAAGITVALNGAAAAAVAFGAIKFANDIDKEFQLTRATVGATDAEIEGLRHTAEEVTASLPVGFAEVTKQINELAGSGVTFKEINDGAELVLASLTKLSKVPLNPIQSAEQLAAIGHAYENLNVSIKDVGDAILGVTETTSSNIPEVFTALQKVSGEASVLKIPINEVSAAIAVLSENGVKGEQAGTALRNIFIRLSDAAAPGAAIIKQYGISLYDTQGNARDLGTVLQSISEAIGQQAVAEGKLTQEESNRLLGTVFQTRALQAVQLLTKSGTDEYLRLLGAIGQTDVYAQAATATDNLGDKLTIVRNKMSILLTAFGTELLPGLKTFVNGIDATLGEAIKPSSPVYQNITLLGQALASLASSQSIGEVADSINQAAGPRAAQLFVNLALAIAGIKDTINTQVIPALNELFTNINQLAGHTIFDPENPKKFGDAIDGVIGFVAGLVRALAQITKGVDENRQAFINFGVIAGQIIGGISSALGSLTNALANFVGDLGRDFIVLAGNIGTLTASLAGTPLEGLTEQFNAINLAASNVGTALITGSQGALAIGRGFNDASTAAASFSTGLQTIQQRAEAVQQLSTALHSVQDDLSRLQQQQLAASGPDVSKEISDREALIYTIQQELALLNDNTGATSTNTAERQRGIDTIQDEDASTRNLAQEQADAKRAAEALVSETNTLTKSYEDLSREVDKVVRDTQQKIDDAVTKVNDGLRKIDEEFTIRITELRSNLRQANQDAIEAFDFRNKIQNQSEAVSQFAEDLHTSLSRAYELESTAAKDAIQDRDRIRQEDLQSAEKNQQEQVDIAIQAHSQENQDLEKALQEAGALRARGLEDQQREQTKGLEEQFRLQNEARKNTEEDTARAKQLTVELANAKTSADRASIQERYNQETTRISDTRQQQTADNKIQQQQQQQLEDLRKQQEQQRLAQQQQQAQAELAIRQKLATDDLTFRKQKEQDFTAYKLGLDATYRAISRGLEFEDTQRQHQQEDRRTQDARTIDQIIKGYQLGIASEEFTQEQNNRTQAEGRAEDKAAQDRDRRYQDEADKFNNETLPDIVRNAGERLGDAKDKILQQVDDAIRKIGSSFPEATQIQSSVPGLIGGAQQAIDTHAAAAPAGIQAETPIEFLIYTQGVQVSVLRGGFDSLGGKLDQIIKLQGGTPGVDPASKQFQGNPTTDVPSRQPANVSLQNSNVLGNDALNLLKDVFAIGLGATVAPRGGL